MKKALILIILFISFNYVLAQTAPDTLWTKTFGGSDYDCARSVKQTTDGGFIITGYTGSYGAGLFDCWLIKTDENGNEEWDQTYGGADYDYAFSAQQTIDGGYIIAGFTYSYGAGESDFWLVKTDENGNEEWNHTYGGVDYDHASSVQQTTDGGYIIAGNTTSYGAGLFNCWLIKTDENGNEEWNHTYGGVGDDHAGSVQQTIDGSYIIAGSTTSFGAGNHDCWLIKTNMNGIEEWNLTYGGIGDDRAYSVQQTQDEGFIIAGSTTSFGVGNDDCWLIKTDENGDEEWNQIYDFDSFDKARSVQQTIDGGYIIAGYGYCVGNIYDAWLIRLGSEVSIANNTIAESLISNLSNYPNPFNPSGVGRSPATTISFSTTEDTENTEIIIYNIKGQKIKTLDVSGSYRISTTADEVSYSITWDGTDENKKPVSSGIYFYKLIAGDYQKVKKMILLR